MIIWLKFYKIYVVIIYPCTPIMRQFILGLLNSASVQIGIVVCLFVRLCSQLL